MSVPAKILISGVTVVLWALTVAGGAFGHPQTTWAPVGRPPLSDQVAAARVTHMPEQKWMNARANNYRPTDADLRYFRTVKSAKGQTEIQFNPLNKYVDGRDLLKHPSTDDLIQWAAHKWGIPTDWLRAQTTYESWQEMTLGGDLAKVGPKWYALYPPFLRSSQGPDLVYESIGIPQIKWLPNETVNWGARYLRYLSTAFVLDYMGAEIRYYYDGLAKWLGPSYHAGNKWLSIGAWNMPAPWGNPEQLGYIKEVQYTVSIHPWTNPGFSAPVVRK